MSKIDSSSRLARGRVDRLFSRQVSEARRFVLGAPAKGSGNLVVMGGFERVESNYAINRRRFPFLSIEFVVGGHGEVRLPAGRRELCAGTIFSYGPGVAHDISTDAKRPLAKYFATMIGPPGMRLLKRVGFRPGIAWQTSRSGDVQRLFDELLIHGARAEPTSRAICDRLLELILMLSVALRIEGVAAGEAFDTYERCCRIIDTETLRLRTLEQTAERCGISPEYLCRLFKRFEKQSPYHRLLRARMNVAAARFRSGNALVKDVASELGYADAYHFSHVFKRVFGCSPASMRGARPTT
ncbi:MAG TPA: AraC family transcriptional regulator [Tepidisphaeraceae bacterium]|nr:AraC family transcriptional regulator [Tepidisphaeraceae bacterium]